MAVQMQAAFSLPEKFEKLKFERYESEEGMSSPSTPSTPNLEPFQVKPIDEKDIEPVLAFLNKFFFRDEPLNINIKLMDGPNATCKELEEYSVSSIKDGLSLKVVSESGALVGVCLNGILSRDDPHQEEECPNPKFAKILNLLNYVDGQVDVFGKFPDCHKVMSVKIVSVDSSWRGRGLAQELVNKTRDLAKEKGCCLMRVDCTSHFSARVVAKMGFECIYKLNYKDYTNGGSTPVFDPEPPHAAITVYIQKVDKE